MGNEILKLFGRSVIQGLGLAVGQAVGRRIERKAVEDAKKRQENSKES